MEQLDISEYSTASGAAKAVRRRIKDLSEMMGQKPEVEVLVEKRSDEKLGERWIVSWEGGPYNWAPELTGGGGGEPALAGLEPEIVGFYDMEGVKVECENSFTLAFYQE